MSNNVDDFMVVVDCETTGLEVRVDELLEVGFMVIDRDFVIIDSRDFVLPHEAKSLSMIDLVRDMHTANGLLDAVDACTTPAWRVDAQLSSWLVSWFGGDKPPMAGSSVHFDRQFIKKFLPLTEERFHYRNIDFSSVKELCRRFNPEVYAKLPDKTTNHRVQNCLRDTVREAQFYADNFLFQAW